MLARAAYRVLIVEDDAEVRCLLEREIADLGHPVRAAADAGQALEELRRDPGYAVVITDIRMPGMDGVQLTQEVKALCPDTEVILITGYASIGSAAEAVRLGAADYLTKPFGDLGRVAESLDRALEKHARRAQARQALRAQREALSQLIERLPMGVLLVTRQGRVTHSNQAARAILEQGDGAALEAGGKLLLPSPHLRALLRSAATDGEGGRRGGAGVAERPSGRAAFSVVVTPFAVSGEGTGDEPAAAVFISDPEKRVETTEDLLGRLYALTPTEARLAAVLMQGKSVEQAAEELEVTTNTARTHLKRVFAKTGTTRQGDLISLLLSGPALVQVPPRP